MDNETPKVEESNNTNHSTPPEQSPEYKKKVYLFLKLSFGMIVLMFVLWIITDKMKNSVVERSENTPKTVPTGQSSTDIIATDEPTDVTTSTFEKLVEQRQKANDVTTQSVTDRVQENVKDVVSGAMAGTSVQSEKERNDALEYKRAALSSRAAWGLKPTVAMVNSPASTVKSGNVETVTNTPDDMLSTDDQRKMIAERLKKMEQLKQNILAGNYSPNEQSVVQQNITTIENSFAPPPSDIVGYTNENIYQASTEGMLKLPIGSIIPAISIMKADSDRTGTFKAMVTQDIFDVDYEYVLVPKGSELLLKSYRMSNANEVLNSYVGYSVPWLILPNGNKIDMTKSSGLDRSGLAGLSDQVDRHLMAQFLGVAAYALVANGSSYEGSGANTDNSYAGEVSEGLRDQLSPQVQKYLQLRPTNIIRTGQSMNIIIEDEIYLKPWKSIYEDYL